MEKYAILFSNRPNMGEGKGEKNMDQNRPRGREKNVTGQTGSVQKRGSGLGTGPVGGGGRGKPSSGGGNGGGQRSGGGRGPMPLLLVILAMLFGGGGLGAGLLGGGGTTASSGYQTPSTGFGSGYSSGYSSSAGSSSFGGGSLPTGFTGYGNSASSGWDYQDNTRRLDTTVASGVRAKRTEIKGNNKDTVTLMVYMCGTDLESRSGMATSDLQEMINAEIGSNVNLIVYTGGCTGWKNSAVSSSVNQIYQVQKGGLKRLVDNAGKGAMTDPATLTSFIQYCDKNFPANRRELILWDHGGGSVSGYGYDQKYPNSGSMTLSGVDQALKKAGVSFDFIGFDACLMATVETALMLDHYADYLIASEETEPGVGWYYTNWLTSLSKNTSISTLELGKQIADDFVDVCAQKCRGQKTTLSVIDLAEASTTVPSALGSFAKSTTQLIQNNAYQTVATARNQSREFAQSSAIDQIDLVHLAKKINTEESNRLANVLLGAVKYNRTASNMTDAYGLSIYFPCKKASKVDSAVNTYKQIGMDDDYARCIQTFASMQVGGQAAAGGASSALPSLMGSMTGMSSSVSSELLTQLIGTLLTGDVSGISGGISGLSSANSGFLSGKNLDPDAMASYLAENRFDADALSWSSDDVPVIRLSEDQWELVQDLELNVYYDDGEGFVDLGMDNSFNFDETGALVGRYDNTWLAINNQVVAYYYESTVDDGENYTITGHVPAMLNGERVNLILLFDNDHPYGYIAGAVTNYVNGETETVAKSMMELEEGDTLDFLCDYYTYDGEYQDSYYLGEQMVVTEDMEISNITLDSNTLSATYCFTDIYQQQYWTEVLPQAE